MALDASFVYSLDFRKNFFPLNKTELDDALIAFMKSRGTYPYVGYSNINPELAEEIREAETKLLGKNGDNNAL